MSPLRHAPRLTCCVRVCGTLGILAAVLYVAFLTQIGSGTLDTRTSFVSELAARDQPQSMLFRLTDLGAGALIVVLAVGLWLWLAPDRWTLVGCAAVAVLGLATVAVALCPMDCVVTADPICHSAEHTGRVTAAHQTHTVVSVVAATASLVGMGALGWHLRRLPAWQPVGWFGLATLPASAGLCLVMAIIDVGWDSPLGAARLGGYLGVFQRMQLLLLAVWIAALAGTLLFDTSCRDRRRPQEGRADGLAT